MTSTTITIAKFESTRLIGVVSQSTILNYIGNLFKLEHICIDLDVIVDITTSTFSSIATNEESRPNYNNLSKIVDRCITTDPTLELKIIK